MLNPGTKTYRNRSFLGYKKCIKIYFIAQIILGLAIGTSLKLVPGVGESVCLSCVTFWVLSPVAQERRKKRKEGRKEGGERERERENY
jgi:hypothetical protein